MRIRQFGLRRAASFTTISLLAFALTLVAAACRAGEPSAGGLPDECAACYPDPTMAEFAGGWGLFWDASPASAMYCPDQWCHHSAAVPRFYGAVDFMPLFRDVSGSTVFQARATRQEQDVLDDMGNVTDTVISYRREAVLESDDLAAEFEPGLRILAGLSLGPHYRLEYGYFGLYFWTGSGAAHYDAADGTGNLLSPFSNFGDPRGDSGLDPVPDGVFQADDDFDFNDQATIGLSSDLKSFELNLRRHCCVIRDRHVYGTNSYLIGLRYVDLTERLKYCTKSRQHDPVEQVVRTSNNLFGVQIGTQNQLKVHGRAWFDCDLKGAVLFDRVQSSVDANFTSDGVPDTARFDSQEDVSVFLGEVSLQFNYQLAPAWTLRFGYNAVWLSGVALASDNFVGNVATLNNNGPASVDHSGDVVYHGPNFGVVWAR